MSRASDPLAERLRKLPRSDPKVHMNGLFKRMVEVAKNLPKSVVEFFRCPVTNKEAPTYKLIVKKPMDLQTLNNRAEQSVYSSLKEFLEDVDLIYTNSVLFNGEQAVITQNAKIVVDTIKQTLQDPDFKQMIIDYEYAIDLQAKLRELNAELLQITMKLMHNENAHYFIAKPDVKKLKGYEVVVKPIALQMIRIECERHAYPSCESYLADLNLIVRNSVQYNGMDSIYTKAAIALFNAGEQLVNALPPHYLQLTDLRKESTYSMLGVLSGEPISPLDVPGSTGRKDLSILFSAKKSKLAPPQAAAAARPNDLFTLNDVSQGVVGDAAEYEMDEEVEEESAGFGYQAAEDAMTAEAPSPARETAAAYPSSSSATETQTAAASTTESENANTDASSTTYSSTGFIL